MPVDVAFEELRTALQRDWNRALITDRDTLTTAVVTFDYLSNGEVHRFHTQVPFGQTIMRSTDRATINNAVRVLHDNLIAKVADARLRGTDAQIIGIREFRANVIASPAALERRAMVGNAYKKLPKELADKHCCVNIQNEDDLCLAYCLVAYTMWKADGLPANPQLVRHYRTQQRVGNKKTSTFTLAACGLDMRMFGGDVPKEQQLTAFEAANPQYGVYVFEWTRKTYQGELVTAYACPTRVPDKRCEHEVILVLWQNHYVLVTNFHSLMTPHYNTSTRAKHKKKSKVTYKYCHRCSWHRRNDRDGEAKLQEHLESCNPYEIITAEAERKVTLPVPRDGIPPTIQFSTHKALFDVPCAVVFDMEMYRFGNDLSHVASFGVAAWGSSVYTPPEKFRYKSFINTNRDDKVKCVVEGIRWLIELWDDLIASQRYPTLGKLNDDDEEDFQAAEQCFICGIPKTDEHPLIREHCHFTGEYRGAACKRCNARIALRYIPCYAHNYSGFDSGPIQRAIAQLRGEYDYQPIPVNKSSEKQLALTFGPLQFRDSLALMNGSLGKLIEDSRKGCKDLRTVFPTLATHHCCKDAEDFGLAHPQAPDVLLLTQRPGMLRRGL